MIVKIHMNSFGNSRALDRGVFNERTYVYPEKIRVLTLGSLGADAPPLLHGMIEYGLGSIVLVLAPNG